MGKEQQKEPNLVKTIKDIVKQKLSCSAHNFDHVSRVYNLVLLLSKKEKKVDKEVLKIATLLHDIARVEEDCDCSGKTDHAILGAKMAEDILLKLNFAYNKILHVKDCIGSHRYRVGNEPKTLEAKILFDADKIDALGAIGVARSFVWVGKNNAQIYRKVKINKYIKDNLSGGKIDGIILDKTKHSPQIEYWTKLKFLPERLFTKKGKQIAEERLKFLENFLQKLEDEILGKC